MKKLLCLGLTVAAIFFYFGYKNYRIPPLDEGSRRATVLSAASAECMKNSEWYRGDGAIVLQASPNFQTVKLDGEEITVELLRETLPPVLAVRMDRSVFLVDNSERDDNASLFLEKEIEQIPTVDRICIIDPKHPPTWYPPMPYRGPASGGAKITLRMLGSSAIALIR
jgi:hypothetical protein